MTITKSLNLGLLCACFAAALIMPIPGKSAATKCVNLSSSTTCSSRAEYNRADWSAMCGGNVAVKGIGFCSSTAGSTIGQKMDSLVTNSEALMDASVNKHCWCKMFSPAVSNWVFAASFSSSAGNCSRLCVDFCASNIQNSLPFRSGLFSGLVA